MICYILYITFDKRYQILQANLSMTGINLESVRTQNYQRRLTLTELLSLLTTSSINFRNVNTENCRES